MGKALAVLLPALALSLSLSLSLSLGIFGLSVLVIQLFAHPSVAPAVLRGPELLAQVLFTPLLAAWSIWVGIAVSTRSTDLRVAQQLSMLASLPLVLVAALIAFGVIHASLRLGLGLGAALLVFDIRGWRIVSPMLDRERLITGSKS